MAAAFRGKSHNGGKNKHSGSEEGNVIRDALVCLPHATLFCKIDAINYFSQQRVRSFVCCYFAVICFLPFSWHPSLPPFFFPQIGIVSLFSENSRAVTRHIFHNKAKSLVVYQGPSKPASASLLL
jgi:hypothetical protein